MERRRELFQQEESSGWTTIFSAPFSSSFVEEIYNVTPLMDKNASTSISDNSLRTTGTTQYYSSAVYQMPSDYQNKLINAKALMIEFDIKAERYYYGSSNSNNYCYPVVLGRWGGQYTGLNESSFTKSQLGVLAVRGIYTSYNNTSFSSYPYNVWYHITYTANVNNSGLWTIDNSRGTAQESGVTSICTSNAWCTGSYAERACGVSIFPRRWAAGDYFKGYLKNLTIQAFL